MSSFEIHDKTLTTLVGLNVQSDIIILNVAHCGLTDLNGLPATVTDLNVSNNQNLSTLTTNSAITKITAANCLITTSTLVPLNLVNLYLNNNLLSGNLQFLQNCTKLQVLDLSHNTISSLQYCPTSVIELTITDNSLTNLLYLPTTVKSLNISQNNIANLSNLTANHTLQVLTAVDTTITNLANLPSTCVQFVTNNSRYLTNIPITLKSITYSPPGLSSDQRIALVTKNNKILPFYIFEDERSQIDSIYWKPLGPPIIINSDQRITVRPFKIMYMSEIIGNVNEIVIRIIRTDVVPGSTGSIIYEKTISEANLTRYEEFGQVPLSDSLSTLEFQGRVTEGSGLTNVNYGIITNCLISY